MSSDYFVTDVLDRSACRDIIVWSAAAERVETMSFLRYVRLVEA